MKRYLLIFILTSPLVGSCQSMSKDAAFKKYFDSIKTTQEYKQVRTQLKDTMLSWIKKELYEVLYFKNAIWQVDDKVYFNKNKTRALLSIVAKSKSSETESYLKVIGAEKINSKWNFYYASYPIDNFYGQSFQFMSDFLRKELIDDGYISCTLGCRINYNYVDSDVWFADWMREQHSRFLNGTLPKLPDSIRPRGSVPQ